MGRVVCRQEPGQERENPAVTPIIPPNPLQQLRDLDRASPEFHKQLSSFLHGMEYQDVLLNLQGENLVWFVEYLDSMSHKTISAHSVLNTNTGVGSR